MIRLLPTLPTGCLLDAGLETAPTLRMLCNGTANELREKIASAPDVTRESLLRKSRTSHPSMGIVFTAVGPRFVAQARESARSIQRYANLPVTLFTDDVTNLAGESCFDEVRRIDPDRSAQNKSQFMLDRLQALSQSPYDYTLALDCDTYVLTDISDTFNVLDRFDLGMTHVFEPKKRLGLAARHGVLDDHVPKDFPLVQGGFILYRQSTRMRDYLARVVAVYKENNYFDDQIAFRQCMWDSPLRVCLLPREHNFCQPDDLLAWGCKRDGAWIWPETQPRMLHYIFKFFRRSARLRMLNRRTVYRQWLTGDRKNLGLARQILEKFDLN